MAHKKLPNQALEYIGNLYRSQKLGIVHLSKKSLRDLDPFKESTLIKYIFFLVFDPNDEIALEAGRMVAERLRDIDAKKLSELDLDLRESSSYSYFTYSGYKPENLMLLNRFSNPAPLLGVCTFFPSGYVREEALRQLSQYTTGEELKFLLLRLNDWVPEVKKIAKKEILRRIDAVYLSHFVNCLDLVERMYCWKREDHKDIISAIEKAIVHADAQEHLLAALKHKNFRIRRKAVCLAAQALPPLQLYHIISHDQDSMVRWLYLKNVKDQLDRAQLLELTEGLRHDASVRVRREALSLAADHLLSNAHDLLSDALYDTHTSMRALAQWYLKKQGYSQVDFQTLYRRFYDANPEKAHAVLGLGEVGQEQDAYTFQTLLNHSREKIRKAAFIAIAHLKPALLRDVALNNLQIETRSMALIAKKFIQEHLDWYTISEFWSLFQSTSQQQVKMRILSLFDHAPKWLRFLYLLKASKDSSPEIKNEIATRLKRWTLSFNRSFISPSPDELCQIREAIDKSPFGGMEYWIKDYL